MNTVAFVIAVISFAVGYVGGISSYDEKLGNKGAYCMKAALVTMAISLTLYAIFIA